MPEPSSLRAPGPRVDTGGWQRRRLLMVLAAVAVTAAALVAGLVYALVVAVASAADPKDPAQTGSSMEPADEPARGGTGAGRPVAGGPVVGGSMQGRGQARRDRIALAPMLAVTPSDARPGTPAAVAGPSFVVPAATGTGPAGVPTGFPRTPGGAVGQLAAIETTVLQAMSIPVAHAVHDAWALPGGTGAGEWSLTGHVRSFLGAARMGAEKDLRTVVMATPAGAQVKGTDGPDWVLACVLLEVRAVIEAEARIGYGHCERMQWQPDPNPTGTAGGRWMIAPGDPPALAPSTWPGGEQAIAAGWKTWVDAEPAPAPGSHDPAATALTAGAGVAEDRG